MVFHLHTRVGFALVLGLSSLAISGATPKKALETVEIDGKGNQKTTSKEVHHDTQTNHESPGHSHEKEVGHDVKPSKHNEKKAKEPAHKGVPHAAAAKSETPHVRSEKEQPSHASMAQQSVFSDEEEDDAALDELEAMTIARTFERKRSPPWGPPAAVPCTWQEWENEGSCGVTCGGRGKDAQKQTRGSNPAKHGGGGCQGKKSRQVECAIEECPTTTITTEEEVTTTTGGALRMADLSTLVLLSSLTCGFSLLVW
jgi:hypothetical protein